ncbi:hypothetical protein [Streptomyces xanthophaeus]|uniref:DUF1877 family protein n=1 Tax=Streptomyces xanthophaeus TaxID=67385 RepID=A0A919GVM0_9ACTN|nr:hypothetical protein [Streptomyces xanthophaeus]GHI85456.1 hypothetical protein Sxan_28200 [Streptomyces xanthophaeus]
MSTLVTFFAAPDEASAALVAGFGPGGLHECLSYGNFDPEEAVLAWECLLSGSRFEELAEAGEPRVIAGEDGEGGLVLALSGGLVEALAQASAPRLVEASASWAGLRARDGEPVDPELAAEILTGLGTLARAAGGRGHRLYCWAG